MLDGSGKRHIEGALDPGARVVFISGSARRSTIALLYGAHGLARTIKDESGRACYTVPRMTALVKAQAQAAGRSATVELVPPLPSEDAFADERAARYTSGCAVVTDVHAARDGRTDRKSVV